MDEVRVMSIERKVPWWTRNLFAAQSSGLLGTSVSLFCATSVNNRPNAERN
jgi:hypothetical protein